MKIDCLHGYYKFQEDYAGELSHFVSRFGFELDRSGDHFTFSDLTDAPDFSIQGGTFIAIPTIKTFEGKPWDVMRENELVYDFTTGLIVPIASVVRTISLSKSGNYFTAGGMILAGSLTDEGERVTDYAAHYIADLAQFRYSEIEYE